MQGGFDRFGKYQHTLPGRCIEMDSTGTAIKCPIEASQEHDQPAREKQDRKAADRAAVVNRLAQIPGVIVASAMIR